MGGSAAILPTVDPMATLDNPAQLGLFALANTFSAGTFAPKTVYFEGFSSPYEPNPTLDLTALSAGINLANILPVPVPLSLGLGYSRSSFDLGYYPTPPSGFPDVISPPIMWGTHPVARVESFSLGLGVDYWVRFGFGLNFKHGTEDGFPFETPSGRLITSPSAWAHDLGLLLVVPVADIVSRASGRSYELLKGFHPQLDLSTAYALANVGNEVRMPGAAVAGPLPRKARVGLGLEAALKTRVGASDWKLISASILRQADTYLWHRAADGTVLPYDAGAGSINILQNVIEGKYTTDRIWVRKGWQVELGECVTLRGGSVGGGESERVMIPYYQTYGYTFSLGGLVRTLEYASSAVADHAWLAFIGDHLDLQFSRSIYQAGGHAFDGMSFQALNLVVKGLPWK